jgi:hypothetical protein
MLIVNQQPWIAHIEYLEAEVNKLEERARKLEAMIPNVASKQKKLALRELVSRLRDEAAEHSKYLALVKQK